MKATWRGDATNSVSGVTLASSGASAFTGDGAILNISAGNGSDSGKTLAISHSGSNLNSTAVSINKSGAGVGRALDIVNAGTSAALQITNSSTGQALDIQGDVKLDTATGNKIGTATSQKLAFYNSTPVVQPTGNIPTALSNLGLVASPTLANADLPNGLSNANSARQSQVVVSATSYYITSSNLNLPATLKNGMAVGTRFRWTVCMDKTAAGTGTFQVIIYRGTNGSTADTADVTQTIGTQTAVVDSMVLDVQVVVTTTGASGAYFWSICPRQAAATATGFGVATGTTGLFTGTVSAVAMNTSSLIFGLGFKATTSTPTISVPLVEARAVNIN
jgi:hypothetical protein